MQFIFKKKYSLIMIAIIIGIGIFILSSKIGLLQLAIPFLWGTLFAYILNPIVNMLERLKIRRTYAVIILYILLATFIFVIIRYILPGLVKDMNELLKDIPLYSQKIMNKIEQYRKSIHNHNIPFAMQHIIDHNIEKAQRVAVDFINQLLNSSTKIFAKIFDILLIPIITFYLLKDERVLKAHCADMLPKKYKQEIVSFGKDINLVMSQFARSQLVIGLFVGIVTTIALAALRVKFAIFIGIVAGVGEIIPYFGPILSIVPAVMLAYIDYPMKAVWVIVVILLIQQIEGNVLTPMVMGDRLGLHPLIVMFAVIIGGKYFGVIGMLLSVPVACILKVLLLRFRRRNA